MDYKSFVQQQVSAKDLNFLHKLGVALDGGILASLWPDFVDFEKRAQSEVPFLLDCLNGFANPRIFDASLGSGATTLGLKRAGLENIISNEIDTDLISAAKKEAHGLGLALNVTSYDWRELSGRFQEEFDAILCLGNSLTYLFKRHDHLQVLENFRSILKPNGRLIIDERNYPHHFFRNRYRHSGTVVYCGKDKVEAHPLHISESMVVMEYKHRETGDKAHLVLYPFKEGEMRGLLNEVGFKDMISFGDYNRMFKPEQPEFITYTCRK